MAHLYGDYHRRTIVTMMLEALMEVYSDIFETWGEWAERWQMLFAGMDLWMPFKPADGVQY